MKPQITKEQIEAELLLKKLLEQRDELLSACWMAREELCFGGDWINAKKVINEAIKKATE